jgi:hypothetical protein
MPASPWKNTRALISVNSKEGAGTSFQLWLPEADFSESAGARRRAARAPARRAAPLLVGQAGEVLNKTAELLRSHNYHVVVAAGADNPGRSASIRDYQFAGVLLLAEPNDPALKLAARRCPPAEQRPESRVETSGVQPGRFGRPIAQGLICCSTRPVRSRYVVKTKGVF